MIPPKDRPRLGSLVSVGGREAFVCAISRAEPPVYQVSFLTPRGERKDHLGPDDLVMLDIRPIGNERLSASLRAWITKHS